MILSDLKKKNLCIYHIKFYLFIGCYDAKTCQKQKKPIMPMFNLT